VNSYIIKEEVLLQQHTLNAKGVLSVQTARLLVSKGGSLLFLSEIMRLRSHNLKMREAATLKNNLSSIIVGFIRVEWNFIQI